jgi:hypothetical protein
MALIKKRDVPSYFAERKRKGLFFLRSTSQSDATGFSRGKTATSNIKSGATSKDLAPKDVAVSSASPGGTAFRNVQA